MSAPTQLVNGLGGAIGSDFRQLQNQLVFVEYNGNLSRLNLFRTATTITSGTTLLKESFGFNLDTGVEDASGSPLTGDIWWYGTVPPAMIRIGAAQMVNIGVTGFNAITADTLQSLTYAPSNIPAATFVTGDVFAVLTNGGNYCKVLVVSAGANLEIQWVTYKLDSPYKVLGSGYQQPEDVKASLDGLHVYVTERAGNLLKVPLASPNRTPAMVLASGMTAPQQMFLDETHQTAYVVEYAASGRLWQINLTTGVKTPVLTGLQNAVGVTISADLQYAYISEQTSGADLGRVSQFQLSNGSRQLIVNGLTAPFFLTWLDPSTQTSLLMPQRDPANNVIAINIAARSFQVVETGVAYRPSSVAIATPGEMLICCNDTIEEAAFAAVLQPSGPLLMGLGFIPFDKVVISGANLGRADTTVDPTYFYQVQNTPFGGSLPLMVNYMRALNDATAYYRVYAAGMIQNVTWTDEHWNGFEYVAQTTGPVNVAGQPGFYPVRALSDLFLWMNPSLGGFIDSTGLPNGLNTLILEFVDGAGNFIEWSSALTILVDNDPSTATIAPPTLNGASADPTCGLLNYSAKNSDLVAMAFTASQPNGNATFSFGLVKGVNPVALPAPTSGDVSAAPGISPITATVANLLGSCTIAGFAELVYVYATANNGWGRQSQYDASATIAFVLAPK